MSSKSTFGATKSTFGAKKYCSKVFDSQNLLVMQEHLPRTLPRNILSIFSGWGSTIFFRGGAGRGSVEIFRGRGGPGQPFLPGAGRASLPPIHTFNWLQLVAMFYFLDKNDPLSNLQPLSLMVPALNRLHRHLYNSSGDRRKLARKIASPGIRHIWSDMILSPISVHLSFSFDAFLRLSRTR